MNSPNSRVQSNLTTMINSGWTVWKDSDLSLLPLLSRNVSYTLGTMQRPPNDSETISHIPESMQD